MSLWMRPCWWTLASAAAARTAMRRNLSRPTGVPMRLLSNSPPGSSSTNMLRPGSRTSSSGRTAQAASSSSLKEYSRARRSRVAGAGCSDVGNEIRTSLRPPAAPSCHPRPKTSSPSSDKISRIPIPLWPKLGNASNLRASPLSWLRRAAIHDCPPPTQDCVSVRGSRSRSARGHRASTQQIQWLRGAPAMPMRGFFDRHSRAITSSCCSNSGIASHPLP